MSLALADVEHRFGSVHALRGVDAAFQRGRITVLLGPNGAGKSTLLRVAADLLRPTRGSVALDGRPLRARDGSERAARLGYVAQRPLFAAGLAVRDVVALGLVARRGGFRRSGVAQEAIARAIAALRLEEIAEASVTSLSVGQQQRVAIARTLAQTDALRDSGCEAGMKPEASASSAPDQATQPFLLLDEPFASLDPAHVLLVLRLLRGCAARGCGVVAAVHDLPAAAALADEALILRDGLIAARGSAAAMLTPEVLEPVYEVRFERLGDLVVPRWGDAR